MRGLCHLAVIIIYYTHYYTMWIFCVSVCPINDNERKKNKRSHCPNGMTDVPIVYTYTSLYRSRRQGGEHLYRELLLYTYLYTNYICVL